MFLPPARSDRQPARTASGRDARACCDRDDGAMCGIFGGTPDLIATDAERLLLHRGPDQQGRVVVAGRRRAAGRDRPDAPERRLQGGRADARCSGTAPSSPSTARSTTGARCAASSRRKGYRFETPTDTEVVLCGLPRVGTGVPRALERHVRHRHLARRAALPRPRPHRQEAALLQPTARAASASRRSSRPSRELDFAEVPICQALEFYFDEYTPVPQRPEPQARRSTCSGRRATNEVERQTWWTLPRARARHRTTPSAPSTSSSRSSPTPARIRKVADVPVTIFLSGGVDSSLIQAVLALSTSPTRSSSPSSRRRSTSATTSSSSPSTCGFEPRIVTPTRDDFLETFSDLARFIEFPVGSQSVLPLFCLARQARRDGFVVALSGEGSDELFNGYYRNELLLREDGESRRRLRGPLRHALPALLRRAARALLPHGQPPGARRRPAAARLLRAALARPTAPSRRT